MKEEVKVAWPKSHAINDEIQDRLRRGESLDHGALIQAVADPDGQKVFRGHQLVHPNGPARDKGDFVLLHYSVLLRDAAGRIATFKRAKREEGQDRITYGASVLLSSSTPVDPKLAVPGAIRDSICVSARRRIDSKSLVPRGVVWNPLPPQRGLPSPTYLMALYEHRLPDGLRVFGRWKHSPDSLLDWVPPETLQAALRNSGYVDQLVAKSLASGDWRPSDEHGVLYAPESRILGAVAGESPAIEYSHGYNVFVSHAAEDTFAAYALYRFLVEESGRDIYPTVDVDDLPDGVRTTKIDRMIEAADALVVVITPTLLSQAAARARNGDKDWVRQEVEMALAARKPVFGFKLGTYDSPPYLPENLIANKKALYSDWQVEVQRLIRNMQDRFPAHN